MVVRRPTPAEPCRHATGELPVQPLSCPTCGAPVPLGEGDSVACPSCGAAVAIPEEHVTLREAARTRGAARAEVEEAYRRIGAPPGLLLMLWAGAASGIAGAFGRAIKAVLFVWYGIFRIPIELASAIDEPRIALVVLAVPLALFLGILWLAVHALRGLAPLIGADLVDTLSIGGALLGLGGLLFLLFVVPIALHGFATAFTRTRLELQGCLAARPPTTPGGPAICRNCGAALDVARGALGARCVYCRADNLVALPSAWVDRATSSVERFILEARAAVEEERETRRNARWTAWAVILIGLLIVPVSGALGWIAGATNALEQRGGWRPAVDGRREPLLHVCTVVLPKCAPGYDLALRRHERLVLAGRGNLPVAGIRVRRIGQATPMPLRWEREPDGTMRGELLAPVAAWYVIEAESGVLTWEIAGVTAPAPLVPPWLRPPR